LAESFEDSQLFLFSTWLTACARFRLSPWVTCRSVENHACAGPAVYEQAVVKFERVVRRGLGWRASGPTPDLRDLEDVTRFNESMDQSLADADQPLAMSIAFAGDAAGSAGAPLYRRMLATS